ncbi:putative neural-cadherin 2 [Hyalella azteca]|uniref:Neural-cadherin 2 n=1 Tax=Hyalella azteca TaxID=294128 RepID=A0A8B7N1A6_HYAAZ|nr:putative neural-cadherin 2 [Hyalella azteca]
MDASSSDALHENNGAKQSYFKGCLRNIRLNGELLDLGENVPSHRSEPGCVYQNCAALRCPANSNCEGSPGDETCECKLGWSGHDCSTKTVPTSFSANSFLQIALLFQLPEQTSSITLRATAWWWR